MKVIKGLFSDIMEEHFLLQMSCHLSINLHQRIEMMKRKEPVGSLEQDF